jgi:multisubunit Na+/H+ antiporter MnhC subunit
MTDLIDRYIRQVGQYVPPKDRAEIEAELRSLIQDRLDDRYGMSPSGDEIVTVLKEMGDPRHMAISYHPENYLIGPSLYPWMMMILRQGWVIVPSVVLFLSLFDLFVSSPVITINNLIIAPIWASIQGIFIFSGVVVLIFALIQRWEIKPNMTEFDPQRLPKTDDPRIVNRFEARFGVVLGMLVGLLFIYYLSVGGLTLRFNPSDVGDIIPIPIGWTVTFIVMVMAMVMLNLFVLWRGYWDAWLWIAETFFEMVGNIALYFVVYQPIFERIVADNPPLGDIPLPQIIVITNAVITLVNRGLCLMQLWRYRPPFTAQ